MHTVYSVTIVEVMHVQPNIGMCHNDGIFHHTKLRILTYCAMED